MRGLCGGCVVLASVMVLGCISDDDEVGVVRHSPAREISEDAIALLEAHGWPGNVRELKNEIARALVVTTGAQITPDSLSDRIKGRLGSEENEGDLEGWNQSAVSPMRTLTNKIKAYALKRE